MRSLGPGLKLSLFAWAIFTAIIILAFMRGLNQHPWLSIWRNLLGAVVAGLFLDWMCGASGNNTRDRHRNLSLLQGNPALDHYRQGNAFIRRGDTVRAIESFSKALRFHPGFADALISRGSALSKKGDYENAIADFTEALALDPKNAKAYYYRGSLYGRRGNYGSAVADFERSLRFHPGQEKVRAARELAMRKIAQTEG
jgi:tetratricopeptide (TPR) repeat protein